MYKALDINAATDFERVDKILNLFASKKKVKALSSMFTLGILFGIYSEIKRQLGCDDIMNFSACYSYICSLDDEWCVYLVGLNENEIYIVEDRCFRYNSDNISFVGHISEKDDTETFRKFVYASWGYPCEII